MNKMKIGILTFHWAVNYGAVLQAFALQKYLIDKGFKVEIINYKPYLIIAKQLIIKFINLDVKYFCRMINIMIFIKKNMILSNRMYLSNKQLMKNCKDYDLYISGSDQIWNTSFTIKAEGKVTLSYYLNFVPSNKKRIAYAASFGTDQIPKKVKNIILPELKKYNYISVREYTGKLILDDLFINSKIVLDPTFLIEKNIYNNLFSNIKYNKKDKDMFLYIIHNNQETTEKIVNYVCHRLYGKKCTNYGNSSIGIETWLKNIKGSKIVITNSYHGLIFALIFKILFIVIPVEGIQMNNRIFTLLNLTGLQERLIENYDESKINDLIKKKIEWKIVDERISNLRKESFDFIEKAIKE